MHHSASSQSFSSLSFVSRIAAALLLTVSLSPAAHATAIATTTQLSIPVPTVAVRVSTLLVATVTDASNHPVLQGTVTFYDGSRILGSAQIVSRAGGSFTQGTANLKSESFLSGANSITAVFAGTTTDLSSTSPAKTVTVTGTRPTTTVLTPTVTPTGYTLSAALQNFGSGPATGSVDFLNNTTTSILGTVPLSTASWTTKLLATPQIPLEYAAPIVGDFNGDGFPDLVFFKDPALGDAYFEMSVLIGNGNGTFQPAVNYATAIPANFFVGLELFAVADFNNDGKLDVAIADQGTLGIMFGNGDGTLQPETLIGSADSGTIQVADFNRDGNLDFMISGSSSISPSDNVTVWLGKGDGTFQPQQPVIVPQSFYAAAVDLNGDGIPDLLVPSQATGVLSRGYIFNILLGNGDGTFGPPKSFPFPPRPYPYLTGIALGDLNGDGKVDMVVSDDFNTLSVYFGNGDGTFQPPTSISVGGSPWNPVITDINGDGKPDIAVGVDSQFNTGPYNRDYTFIQVLLGNGDGTFQPSVDYLVEEGQRQPIGFATDLNGDGRPDFMITGSLIFNAQTAAVQLAGVDPPASRTELVQAKYSGDSVLGGSASNVAELAATSLGFGAGFAGSGAALQLNGGSAVVGTGLQLTGGAPNETASAFTKTPLDIRSFTTDFTFQITDPNADGFTFTLQNDKPNAIGGPGGGLGYSNIPNSVAIKFDLYGNAGEGPNSTGLYTGGAYPSVPAINLTGTGIDLHSGHVFRSHITYDGTNLILTITDTVSHAGWSYFWTIDLPSTIGGSTAYVGFTGATGAGTSTTTISGWTYVAGAPAPNFPLSNTFVASDFVANSFVPDFQRGGLNMVFGTQNQSGSIYSLYQQNIQAFTSDFTIQQPGGDGFTFTIQNDRATALGGIGSGLGYSDIPKSVAIKFDAYNNAGEGPNSTGLYLDGARPNVPAVNLTGTGIDLHSGDILRTHIVYDGANLTMTLTDTVTLAGWSHSWPVDIPAAVGGDTAWVGFTASTGAEISVPVITEWIFRPGTP